METSPIVRQVKANLKDRGFSVSTCPIERPDDFKQDLEAPLKRGLLG